MRPRRSPLKTHAVQAHPTDARLPVPFDARLPAASVAQPVSSVENRDLFGNARRSNRISRILGIRLDASPRSVALSEMGGRESMKRGSWLVVGSSLFGFAAAPAVAQTSSSPSAIIEQMERTVHYRDIAISPDGDR